MMCPNSLFCLHRARFHVALASLGKTAMEAEERKLLAYNDFDGGLNITNLNVTNAVFLYEQTQLGNEHADLFWDDLAQFLNIADGIAHEKEGKPKGRPQKNKLDICLPKYDELRIKFLNYSYEFAMWMQLYFIPVARDETREDVVVSNADWLHSKMEEYKLDPCGRLVQEGGEYLLPSQTIAI